MSLPQTLIPSAALRLSSPPLRRRILCPAASRRLHVTSAAVLSDSLRILEWDRLCDSVASFAGTSLGRDASKEQLWTTDVSYEESQKLLRETEAAIQMIDYGAGLDFTGLDAILVKSAIDHVLRGLPVDGIEAMAVVSLIHYAETLQITLKTALKEDADWYNRFMPLTPVVMDFIISRPFVKSVQQVIDEDGSVKDNASSELKRSRDQVRVVERKLHQLMDKLIREDKTEAASLEACSINGRWCIKTMDQSTTFDGLLLYSGSGTGSLLEPIAAVSLNDELQQAKLSMAMAEEDVLSRLSDKMLPELDNIQNLLRGIVRLDIVAARAKYSTYYGGTFPHLYMPPNRSEEYTNNATSSLHRICGEDSISHLPQMDQKLYMTKAYHPLLLQQHRESLHKARKDLSELRKRRLQGKVMVKEDDMEFRLASAKPWAGSPFGNLVVPAVSVADASGRMDRGGDRRLKVSELESHQPIPVDFIVSAKTGALVITGPNTGGKTISLKTVGLASLMAKTGLYVLASEPVKVPWFDAIYADIGDEQSLTQSLSTFSGHLKQISAIRSHSTNKSLVLLDEVGAGTNPLEGAALGMSLLECFAKHGSFLTIATTHHGELKTLKYCNDAFENACVEFDEESLKPTYKILWGVPGRSNAINVAERIGLPHVILDNARKLYGTSSAEINGVITDMEAFKQTFQKHLEEAHDLLRLSRKLSEDLLRAKQKVAEHRAIQRQKRARGISESAAIARSILRNKLQQFRAFAMTQKVENVTSDSNADLIKDLMQSPHHSEHSIEKLDRYPSVSVAAGRTRKSAHDKQMRIPEVGDMVFVRSLAKHGMVLKVEESKGDIIVKASNIKLRLKLKDIDTP